MTKGEDKELFITKLVSFSWKHVLETWAGNSKQKYACSIVELKMSSIARVWGKRHCQTQIIGGLIFQHGRAI